jgi:hypothetical protein
MGLEREGVKRLISSFRPYLAFSGCSAARLSSRLLGLLFQLLVAATRTTLSLSSRSRSGGDPLWRRMSGQGGAAERAGGGRGVSQRAQ